MQLKGNIENSVLVTVKIKNSLPHFLQTVLQISN